MAVPAIAGGDPETLKDARMAGSLGLSTRTIAFHKYQAMKALDLTSSAQPVRFAVESRLVAAGGL